MDIERIFERVDKTGEFDRSSEKEIYDMIVAEMAGQLEAAGIEDFDDETDAAKVNSLLSGMRMVVKYAPGTKFLGEGSSRYVYALGDSGKYVLKCAKNYQGLVQNKNEIEVNETGSADYDCFVRVLKYDPAMAFVVEDRCRPTEMADWKSMFGMTLFRFVQILRIVVERNAKDMSYSVADLLEECRREGSHGRGLYATFAADGPMEESYDPEDWDRIVSFLEHVAAAQAGREKSPKWRSVADLFRFYFDNGAGRLVFGELPWAEQWGICGEGAETRIVLVDPGVSEDFAVQA